MFVNGNENLFSVNEGHGLFVHVIPSSLLQLRACLHGDGGPQIGEVTCGGSSPLSCKRDQIKMRFCGQAGYSPKRITSPTWGPPPPCKQGLFTRRWGTPGRKVTRLGGVTRLSI